MGRINVSYKQNLNQSIDGPATVQKAINTTPADWHALVAGGAALNVVAGFNNPSAVEADRIPELIFAGGGAVASIELTLVGTWNGEVQTETKTCLKNETTKMTKPFDTVTEMTSDVDPGANTTLRVGDSYFDPPTHYVFVGVAGNIAIQLSGETAVKTLVNVPGSQDWRRRARRIAHTTTTATGLHAAWVGGD